MFHSPGHDWAMPGRRYTAEIKARVSPDLAAAFQTLCAEAEVPVSQELRRLMRNRVAQDANGTPRRGAAANAATAGGRVDSGY
jgi:hypothetical protein